MSKRSLDDLASEIKVKLHLVGSRLRHVNSGGEYEITSLHYREHDMALCAEYAPVSDDGCAGHLRFSRPLTEIHDGRFMFIGGRVSEAPVE